MTATCPFCGSAGRFAFRTTDVNRRISATAFTYDACEACRVFFLRDVPTDLGTYYGSAYYARPATSQALDHVAARLAYQAAMVRDGLGREHGTLLEVGPAYGAFARAAQRAGFKVDAIEMDADCCAYLRDAMGINAVQSADPASAVADMRPHDAITLWHVLEHVPRPAQVLQALMANLKPGGVLLVATPNPDAWQFRLMGSRWPHVDAPRHLQLIPSALLVDFFTRQGYHVVSLVSDDPGGKSWDRFGWQRLVMNLRRERAWQRFGFVVGTLMSFLFRPMDARRMRGAAYTLIVRKPGS